jgi:hypothetical protein
MGRPTSVIPQRNNSFLKTFASSIPTGDGGGSGSGGVIRTEAPAMARGKRGLNARTQPRNSRGQFAPAPEVIFIDCDDDNVSSEVRVPRG